MNDDYKVLISAIQEKAKLINSLYQKSLVENKLLQKEKEELKQTIEEKEKKIKEIENKYNTLKLAKTLTAANQDVSGVKGKINKLVREIDKCIALLNQ